MPLDFLKRRGRDAAPPAVEAVPEEVSAEEYSLKLYFAGKSSNGVRMRGGAGAARQLPELLAGLAKDEIEVVEPLEPGFEEASPRLDRPREALQWLQANEHRNAVTRHALYVLESMDAVDPAFETLAVSLLDGELDTAGYPRYNAVVGGAASHWDEGTGEMLVRAVVGWGGNGVRGDTDRIGSRLLANLFAQILASADSLGVAPTERPVPTGGRGGLVCTHCGFASLHERAFYCPKCGMRLLRG